MGTPFLHEIKRQASFFFKDKIKSARLALTDVTPAQLLTEDVTNESPWTPDTRTMGLISQAAFEVDDYWRIVDIIHKRLLKFERNNWRGSYKALVLLEHLLTHGPKSVAEEFQSDKDAIKEMGSFQYVDEKGFNWGLSVRKKSERILELLENVPLLEEERGRARKITRGIKGFGSFSQQQSFSVDGSLKELACCRSTNYGRCNSQYSNHQNHTQDGDQFITLREGPCFDNDNVVNSLLDEPAKNESSWSSIEDGMMHDKCDSQTSPSKNVMGSSMEILLGELREWNVTQDSKPLLG